MSILDEYYNIDEQNDRAICEKLYREAYEFFTQCNEKYNYTWSSEIGKELRSTDFVPGTRHKYIPSYLCLNEIHDLKTTMQAMARRIEYLEGEIAVRNMIDISEKKINNIEFEYYEPT